MPTTYRIHPAIGIARVGDSPSSFYIAPEETGHLPLELDGTAFAGFRDHHKIRRQAARFKVYRYDTDHPHGTLVEIGGDVVDIEWTVHVANKKAAWYEFQQLSGHDGNYANHPLRNAKNTHHRHRLTLDPGAKTVSRQGAQTAQFEVGPLHLHNQTISTLGELQLDDAGNLLVLGGHGSSGAEAAYSLSASALSNLPSSYASKHEFSTLVEHDAEHRKADAVVESLRQALAPEVLGTKYDNEGALRQALTLYLNGANTPYLDLLTRTGQQPRIDAYPNNDFWFDDVSDGPVTATLVLSGNHRVTVQHPAWVIAGPPGYAPEIVNMVTLYDTMYDVAVREKGHCPDLYDKGAFKESYRPDFQREILPILQRPDAYRWVAGLDNRVRRSHRAIQEEDAARAVQAVLRQITTGHNGYNTPNLMPALAGDNPISNAARRNYMTLTATQLFLLSQWAQGKATGNHPRIEGEGQKLDRVSLEHCVGGPFCPGIEMTWISRDHTLYSEPFRIRHRPSMGVLGTGYIPRHSGGLEAGDITKFMACPWQADFNECSNQIIDDASLWWWPAQRPYQVYTSAADVESGRQPSWTRPDDIQFNFDAQMVAFWKKLGFIRKNEAGLFLETERTLTDDEVTASNQTDRGE